MKISKSKQELARIISENGGWREGAGYLAMDTSGMVCGYLSAPKWSSSLREWTGSACFRIFISTTLAPNHQRTILSSAEYFHLYPATDADEWIEWKGGECPVGGNVMVVCKVRTGKEFRNGKKIKASILRWRHTGGMADIIAYRLHKPERENPEYCETVMSALIGVDMASGSDSTALFTINAKPTIEQLAADYRNAKDYAERKQQEADAAKADADEKLRVLELAGEAIGLLVSPITAKQEPELVITDWRDLQAGDVISVSGKWWEPDSEYTVDENDGSRDAPIRVGGYWALIGECSFKFIRRP